MAPIRFGHAQSPQRLNLHLVFAFLGYIFCRPVVGLIDGGQKQFHKTYQVNSSSQIGYALRLENYALILMSNLIYLTARKLFTSDWPSF